MTQAVGAPTATRQDDAAKGGDAQPAEAVILKTQTEETTMTRSDVVALIAETNKGLADQLAALTQAVVAQRSGAPAEVEGEKAAEPTVADVVRSVGAIADNMTKMADAIKALEGSTVIRSDAGDSRKTETSRDVFRGVFGRRDA